MESERKETLKYTMHSAETDIETSRIIKDGYTNCYRRCVDMFHNKKFIMQHLNKEILWNFSQGDLKKLSKRVATVRAKKYGRLNKPKYRQLGYKAMGIKEINAFFNAFKPDEYRFKVMFLTQAFLGLRIGELVKIRVEDIDFQAKQIRIHTEKTKEYYNVTDAMALHPKLEMLLMEYLGVYEEDIVARNNYLFYSVSSGRKNPNISPDYARNIFRRVCDRAGLTEVYGEREPRGRSMPETAKGKLHRYTTHSLRHSFAKYLAKRRVPIEIAKHLLRHSDITSTQVYYMPDKEDCDSELVRAFGGN